MVIRVVCCLLLLSACGDDGGNDTADGGTIDATQAADGGTAQGWLHTSGNAILHADDTPFRGRGANIHDTRSCNACSWGPPSVAEVNRRVDELVDVWGANFMRLALESYATADGRVHWQSFVDDPSYLADIVAIVEHIGEKPGVYVLVSLWVDPSFNEMGWPTAETATRWEALATTLAPYPHVMFGLVNEPQSNFDGSLDAQVWEAMNDTVTAIRNAEIAAGSPQHIISVQGTRAWARVLDYYITRPIEAFGGADIVYETHVYDPPSEFDARFVTPSATLPVIIGEFGPAGMTIEETDDLMTLAEANDVPYLAWTFHMRCDPSLLVDNSGGGCGVDMNLEPTAWGVQLMSRLAQPWGE